MIGSFQSARPILSEAEATLPSLLSIMVGRALDAADRLAEQGISAEVVDLRSIRPLDMTIARSVRSRAWLHVKRAFRLLVLALKLPSRLWKRPLTGLMRQLRVTGKDVPMLMRPISKRWHCRKSTILLQWCVILVMGLRGRANGD